MLLPAADVTEEPPSEVRMESSVQEFVKERRMVDQIKCLGETYPQCGRMSGWFPLIEPNCNRCRQRKQSGGGGVLGPETVPCVFGVRFAVRYCKIKAGKTSHFLQVSLL